MQQHGCSKLAFSKDVLPGLSSAKLRQNWTKRFEQSFRSGTDTGQGGLRFHCICSRWWVFLFTNGHLLSRVHCWWSKRRRILKRGADPELREINDGRKVLSKELNNSTLKARLTQSLSNTSISMKGTIQDVLFQLVWYQRLLLIFSMSTNGNLVEK